MSTPVNQFTLPNGLRVVHRQDNSTAMVALNILYNTGARDESPHLTGMAHLVEHLMFSGSRNVPDYDAQLQLAGGMSNAWTSNDFTNFYAILPAVNAETAFRLESDRMLAPEISDQKLDIQRSVVIEEFKQQCLNTPYGDLGHHLRAAAYKRHPYRWPVIGLNPKDIEKISITDVNQYILDHYAPSNAILAITGNISLTQTLEMVYRWFADIPPRATSGRHYPVDTPPDRPLTATATGNVPHTTIVMAWHMDSYGTNKYRAADTITDILANGRSARFFQNLILTTDLFASVDASITGSEDPGLLMIRATLRHNTLQAEQQAIEAIDSQLENLRNNGITPHELERAVNKFESNLLFSNIHFAAKAQTLAIDTLHGESSRSQVEAYRQLTTDDINDTARELLNPNHKITLTYRPRG